MRDVHPADVHGAPTRATSAWRRWGFLGLALAWYGVNTFTSLDLPDAAVVLVLGLLVMLSVEPDSQCPQRGVAASRRTITVLVLAAVAFTTMVAGRELLLGRISIESIHAVLATGAAIVVLLPRLPEAPCPTDTRPLKRSGRAGAE